MAMAPLERAQGITDIVASDPSPQRRAALTALGAKHVVDHTETDLAAYCGDLTAGADPSVVFDAAGVGAAIATTLPAMAPRGRIVVVGIHERPIEFLPTVLLLQETEILGSLIYTDDDFAAVIAAMEAGHYTTDGWVEHASLDALVDVFGELRAGRRTKVLIDV
jgi:(R,R)-butanediol dehydrogenase / meso-butanediol dehydrogenase / diacetyl reductase